MDPSSRRKFCPECAKEIPVRVLVEGPPTYRGRDYCSTDCAIDAYLRFKQIDEIGKLDTLDEEPAVPNPNETP